MHGPCRLYQRARSLEDKKLHQGSDSAFHQQPQSPTAWFCLGIIRTAGTTVSAASRHISTGCWWLFLSFCFILHSTGKKCSTCLKKNPNASRPSEHPPVRGEISTVSYRTFFSGQVLDWEKCDNGIRGGLTWEHGCFLGGSCC